MQILSGPVVCMTTLLWSRLTQIGSPACLLCTVHRQIRKSVAYWFICGVAFLMALLRQSAKRGKKVAFRMLIVTYGNSTCAVSWFRFCTGARKVRWKCVQSSKSVLNSGRQKWNSIKIVRFENIVSSWKGFLFAWLIADQLGWDRY